MNKLEAYKMDGLGNDFIIFDKRKKPISLSKDQIVKISDRKNIGCDQVILIDKDESNNAFLKFYNSDGGEISACGNGSRCVAYLLMKENNSRKISLRTKVGILQAKLDDKNLVSINMGQPNFEWNKIPLLKEMDNKNLEIKINSTDGKEVKGGFSLSIGNPHIVFFVKNCFSYNLKSIGPKIENYEIFPEKTNVTFAQIIDDNNILVNVWERGAGLTKACGTAACATGVAAYTKKLTKNNVNIKFKEGILKIKYDENENIFMTGPVSEIKKITFKI